MIGQMIGSYEVAALLGKGGMGEVYRAHDSKLDREVALKILSDELSSTPDRLARFEREAKVLASLQHQSITYTSDETGQPQIFVESIEPGHGRWRVSANGGFHPNWDSTGNLLYYQSGGGEILAVSSAL